MTNKNDPCRQDEHKRLLADGGKKERCVLCGRMAGVERDTDISRRECYVPGAGQLCRECYWETYGTTDHRALR